MSETLTWHGHANFRITIPGCTLLIDPWFEGNPSADISLDQVGKADVLLVTHDHQDHIGQALEIARTTGAVVVAVVETAARLVSAGLRSEQVVNTIGMNMGGTVRLGPVEVTMVQAVHTSQSGLPVGYILRLPSGKRVYHAGDTALFGAMSLYGRLFPIDLALLPIGGVFTMDPAQAALACAELGCRAVTPMHWGSFPVLEQSVDLFGKELSRRAPECRLLALAPGETIDLALLD